MSVYPHGFEEYLMNEYGKTPKQATLKELYAAVSGAAMRRLRPQWQQNAAGKTACYFSAEFLVGRLVYSNLYNLGLLDEMKSAFLHEGLNPALFEEVEDAALGNGGLGRLAACFLDSAATEGYRLDGYGIRYKYGLFKQSFVNGFQHEEADDWQQFGDPWSLRREAEKVKVDFAGQSVWALPYDTPVIGYGGKTVNTLRLWQAEPLKSFDFQLFNAQKYDDSYKEQNDAAAIHSVLYPNDDTPAGKRLRLKQQYFFASASLQSILRCFMAEYGDDFARLPQTYAVQLNDTHPTVAIPEMLRLLMQGGGLPFESAFPIVQATFAYTNHTIMAEALEAWDVELFSSLLPQVYPYVVMLNNSLCRDITARGVAKDQLSRYAIVADGRVHMARMAIYATHSTNGVAALHSEILKTDTLAQWYALYPDRFNNKTNGVTQRRWLALSNPELAAFITKRIGDGWITNLDDLQKLRPFETDEESLRELAAIKTANKRSLAAYIQKAEGIAVSADSIFDVQVKRLHEYKRQLLNAFAILDTYFLLKEGALPNFTPMTFIFGAKAAPGYYRAKGIIKYINEIARLIERDPAVSDKLKIVFVQNYNVSYAERIVPAADISEQISTAGTEASGTSNMKLMLNGAVTLGTYDGANIEIVQQAGEENNYIFGARVADLKAIASEYDPKAIYNENPRICRVLDTLIDGTFDDDDTGMFRALYKSLLKGEHWHKADNYYLLLDFIPYVDAKLRINADYGDTLAFSRKCLLNIAGAGIFSSDRTIRQYANEIWGL